MKKLLVVSLVLLAVLIAIAPKQKISTEVPVAPVESPVSSERTEQAVFPESPVVVSEPEQVAPTTSTNIVSAPVAMETNRVVKIVSTVVPKF